MTTIVFNFPKYQKIANSIISELQYEKGELLLRSYPDKESYVRILSDVKNKNIILVCGLDDPNKNLASLIFFSETARELGAKKICLIAPYLGYMRQDKRFNDGEAITSNIFAKLLSRYIDFLITIDPHLHRHKSLDEIYTIPSQVLHAADLIATWIKDNIKNPLLVGPDQESEQWVSDVAAKASAPFIVLTKVRHGDRDVEVSIPQVEKYKNHTPVLVDDIISTAKTMIQTVNHLQKAQMNKVVCIGIHAEFADNSYEELKNSYIEKIITCNTITHQTNIIDISKIIIDAIKKS